MLLLKYLNLQLTWMIILTWSGPPRFSALIIPNLRPAMFLKPSFFPAFNLTLGHPDPMFAIGLPLHRGLDISEGDTKAEPIISIFELKNALQKALNISNWSDNDIANDGWKVVFKNNVFSLYKRRIGENNDGPVEYLMTGCLRDVSARSFLYSNIDYDCRKKWDVTMDDMKFLGIPSCGSGGLLEEGGDDDNTPCEDLLYYRTRWPWPLKDRDYTLARRCRVFEEDQAIILISKSTEAPHCPTKQGVVRVDNYWCHSAFMTHPRRRNVPQASSSSNPSSSSSRPAASSLTSSTVDIPGMTFVTIFCDDQKVPLPPLVVDILSSQGEKVVPESIARLHAVAQSVENEKQNNKKLKQQPAVVSSKSSISSMR